MAKKIDLTGKRFGRLTVVERHGSRNGKAIWHCICDCGGETYSSSGNLRHGRARSCGCIGREKTINRNMKHGGSDSKLYVVWKNMRRRCNSVKDSSYYRYGARGIKVCDEWEKDFGAFRSWALANGYDPNAAPNTCTIDRINGDGDYCPENCRWVDRQTQSVNRQGYVRPVMRSDGCVFPTMASAARSVGDSTSNIRQCCMKPNRTSHGYSFRFVNETQDVDGSWM